MTGIVGIRTLLFHHRYVRPSSPTIITIGARHPHATEVQRSMPPSRNVARQHRHLVTTQPPNHQLVTSFNDTRRRLHPSRQHLEFVRSTSSLLWTTSTARRLQQKAKERRRKKSAKEARREKTEDKDPASTTEISKLQQLGNCNAEPCRRVIQHHLTSMCVCVCIQDFHEDQENTLLCLRTTHSKEELQGSSQTNTSHGGTS